MKFRRARHLFRGNARVLLALALMGALIISHIDWGALLGGAPPDVVQGRADIRDGDSLVIGRHRIRLTGIDAPERDQTCTRMGRSWPCGQAARRHLQRLIGQRAVVCKIVRRDRFDRLLARCRTSARDLNRAMIRDGMAVSFDGDYRREEAEARRAKAGLWAGRFQRPRLWRQSNPRR